MKAGARWPRTMVLALLPLLFISGTERSSVRNNDTVAQGLRVVCNGDTFYAKAGFVFKEEVHVRPNGSTVWTMTIEGIGNHKDRHLKFVINDEGGKEIGAGIYPVSKGTGFLRGATRFFGVANYERLSEMPFFATVGHLRIIAKDKEGHLYGYLNAELYNQEGRSLKIDGSFKAQKERMEQRSIRGTAR